MGVVVGVVTQLEHRVDAQTSVIQRREWSVNWTGSSMSLSARRTGDVKTTGDVTTTGDAMMIGDATMTGDERLSEDAQDLL